jgi:hypothetical protein
MRKPKIQWLDQDEAFAQKVDFYMCKEWRRLMFRHDYVSVAVCVLNIFGREPVGKFPELVSLFVAFREATLRMREAACAS